MTYTETIDYLYSRLPMFSRIGAAAIKADLHNTIALCAATGDPQKKFKSIHIAGTNGKGSTSHMLASVFQAAGYKTGLYTSPHLRDFRERIRINGVMIPEQQVIDLVKALQPSIEQINPSFFEVTVAMAFQYFADEAVDIAIIETGLGGRLDSTNVILPELSVITNIGWDHMNLLGNTLPQIASEKAGIIKPGIPVVIGETVPETLPVFAAKASKENTSLTLAADHYYLNDWQVNKGNLEVELVHKADNSHRHYTLDLPGYYQTKNLMTVLTALDLLKQKGWQLPDTAIKEGLAHVRHKTGLHGRWEWVAEKPDIIIDVAHNTDGIRQVLEQLEQLNFHQLHWVIGVVNDKDISGILSLLPVHATYYFTKAQIPRALPEQELAAAAHAMGLKGAAYPDVNSALNAAKAAAHKEDLILVCGSVFIAGEVRS